MDTTTPTYRSGTLPDDYCMECGDPMYEADYITYERSPEGFSVPIGEMPDRCPTCLARPVEPNEFEVLAYCDEAGCINAALASVTDMSDEPKLYCGDHLRRHSLFALRPYYYRHAQAAMNDRLLRAEAGA